MTWRGVVYTGFFALLLMAGMATGTREIYLCVFALGGVELYALASALAGAVSVRTAQSLTGSLAVRGEKTKLLVQLTGWLPLPVTVEVRLSVPGEVVDKTGRLPEQMYHAFLFPGRLSRRMELKLSCPHRGLWKAGIRRLRIHDIFGLFTFPPLRREAVSPMREPLIVYPRLFELEGEIPSLPVSADHSERHPLTADYGDSLSGTRPYRDGDSLKRIHWIQSVRTRELYTRQYEISSEQYTLLMLDTRVPPDMNRLAYGDMAGEAASALAYGCIARGCPVRLLCLGGGEEPADADLTAFGQEDFLVQYEKLATVTYTPSPLPLDVSRFLDTSWGQVRSLHVITSRPSIQLLEALHEFSQQHCKVACTVPMTATAAGLQSQAQALDVPLVQISCPGEMGRLGEWL